MACIIELLGMPPQKLIEQGKRAKNFISSKGLPRYCTAMTLPDGSTMLNGGKWQIRHVEKKKEGELPQTKTLVKE